MRLSFFPDGSQDCPLLLISHASAEELEALRKAAGDLGSGARDHAVVSVGPDSEVTLVFRAADRDVGILLTPPSFECRLRRVRWENIEGLIEPFLPTSSGYQWLVDRGEVSLILSPSGTW